ncbi:DNA-directed RNA polymerase II [Actinoplanes sp. NPDC048796]|uniref:DNA-directed RNA polymerase II n=1 Tax=unclassified Actinoplanes TaxID=2626549 RepID=UPI0033D6B7C9
MPEQPQWSERTLDMPPQDPWADAPTTPVAGPPAPHSGPPAPPIPHSGLPAPHSGPLAPHSGPPASPHSGPMPPTAPFAKPEEAAASPFSRGRAQVSPQPRYTQPEHTNPGWPGLEAPDRPALSWRWSEMRKGGEWTSAAVLFAFVCWGVWTLSGDGDFGTPVIVFVVTLAVAAGLFCLARLVGHLVLERQFGRVRRSSRGSHLVTALFLAGVGVTFLQQTQWVMTAYHWVTDHLS